MLKLFNKEKENDNEKENKPKTITEHFSIVSNYKFVWIPGITLVFAFIYGLIFNKHCYNNQSNQYNTENQSNQYNTENKIFNLGDKYSSGNPYIDGLYYSIMNTTTVGFGEMYPRNIHTKILAIIHNVLIFVIINFL
tara:strand:- start:130 stop:540 length:411 start_codon:yes stop_codon:yes gene_type:complete